MFIRYETYFVIKKVSDVLPYPTFTWDSHYDVTECSKLEIFYTWMSQIDHNKAISFLRSPLKTSK